MKESLRQFTAQAERGIQPQSSGRHPRSGVTPPAQVGYQPPPSGRGREPRSHDPYAPRQPNAGYPPAGYQQAPDGQYYPPQYPPHSQPAGDQYQQQYGQGRQQGGPPPAGFGAHQ